ncbi:hypothetical protein FOMG_20002 [Fusarium oxysporum f. sp. melonis 26406]|uniref:Uncharacterized protein n=1 Tax=Fusarium oxysporum f. sp. melonis 26406 TaxID=1089452 RepID=W9Z4M9_FUSOX|nr:hypothetical protein FOMG_20002 [Fusarium oxysporum f. sp. melonis 26406]
MGVLHIRVIWRHQRHMDEEEGEAKPEALVRAGQCPAAPAVCGRRKARC